MNENLTEQFDVFVKEHLKQNETRLYNCGGLPVSLTLLEGGHSDDTQAYLRYIYKNGEFLSDIGIWSLWENYARRIEQQLAKLDEVC